MTENLTAIVLGRAATLDTWYGHGCRLRRILSAFTVSIAFIVEQRKGGDFIPEPNIIAYVFTCSYRLSCFPLCSSFW